MTKRVVEPLSCIERFRHFAIQIGSRGNILAVFFDNSSHGQSGFKQLLLEANGSHISVFDRLPVDKFNVTRA